MNYLRKQELLMVISEFQGFAFHNTSAFILFSQRIWRKITLHLRGSSSEQWNVYREFLCSNFYVLNLSFWLRWIESTVRMNYWPQKKQKKVHRTTRYIDRFRSNFWIILNNIIAPGSKSKFIDHWAQFFLLSVCCSLCEMRVSSWWQIERWESQCFLFLYLISFYLLAVKSFSIRSSANDRWKMEKKWPRYALPLQMNDFSFTFSLWADPIWYLTNVEKALVVE